MARCNLGNVHDKINISAREANRSDAMKTLERTVPPLNAGDKLTREEFLRRWHMHPEIKRAELIGGIVYMPSPVSVDHGDTDIPVGTWLGVYMAGTPGCIASDNATTFLLDDSPQPDKHLRLVSECGGTSQVIDGYLHGPPELTAEVCKSSVAYDLHQKLDLYEAAGVKEYVAVLLHEKEIRWHQLVSGSYKVMPSEADGIWRSRVFPGLWLDGAAMLRRDLTQVLAKLQEGLASPDHVAFVERLAKLRK
jgi:Putative restriction endonuclease